MLYYILHDDGMYCTGYRIYDRQGKLTTWYADAQEEENAQEIVNTVNKARNHQENSQLLSPYDVSSIRKASPSGH